MSKKEIERRRKIGRANKGKVPWNKGRKHSEETRERIKRRTREALSNPKIRKKMFGSPRSHSDESKAKISSALRSIWEERLKHRRLQETCYLMWQRSIAEAAKEGGHGQQQLDWDSFHKIKAGSVSQQLQWKADKGSAKQIAKLRAEIVARVRAEKAARLADQMDDKEDNTNAKVVEALPQKKSEGERKNVALRKILKLKERLSKFHHRKKQLEKLISSKKKMAISPKRVIEERDVEIIKSEKPQARVSLADQIQAAKIVKAKLASVSIPALASSNIPLEENSSGF
ncbi:hypothetical protein ACMD2_22002 [Ananas comosus]|nr:hypothetical protein ACMD2_22002 [Ananas comosus]